MAIERFGCAHLVVLRWLWQLDCKAFFCFLLVQAWALPQPVQSSEQQEKNILCATELLLFYWISPRAKLTNLSSQHHPPNPFPPTKLTVPTPKYLYSYITSKHVLATLQTLVLRKHLVSYLEEKWECLVLHTAVEESPSRSVLSAVHQVTIQHNPLSKCTHSTGLKSRFSRCLSSKTSSDLPFFTPFGRNCLPVGGSVFACCRSHWILHLVQQFSAFSGHCPLGLAFLSCSPQIPADYLRKKA